MMSLNWLTYCHESVPDLCDKIEILENLNFLVDEIKWQSNDEKKLIDRITIKGFITENTLNVTHIISFEGKMCQEIITP